MKNLRICLLILSASLFLISCSEEPVKQDNLNNSQETSLTSREEIHSLINNIVKLSANSEFKQLVYDEVSKRFDGDDNVLLTNLNGKSLKSASIDQKYGSVVSALKDKGLYPQIYIPQFEEGRLKSAKSDSPIYIIDGLNANDSTKQFKSVYLDENGEIRETDFLIDENFARNNEVWVISYNERVDIDGESSENLTAKSARVGVKSEYMMKIKCPDLGEIESWIKGAPELRCIMKSAKGNISEQYFYPSKRKYIDNVWWDINGTTGRYLYYWDIESFTKTVLFHWVEVDGAGKNYTYNGSYTYKDIDKVTGQEFTSVSNYTFNWEGYDILCGSITVHIDDSHIGEVYSTGLIEFIDGYK